MNFDVLISDSEQPGSDRRQHILSSSPRLHTPNHNLHTMGIWGSQSFSVNISFFKTSYSSNWIIFCTEDFFIWQSLYSHNMWLQCRHVLFFSVWTCLMTTREVNYWPTSCCVKRWSRDMMSLCLQNFCLSSTCVYTQG